MNKELVIAAYDRDYSWISNLNDSIKKTVYRKGGDGSCGDHEIYLSNNVGRDVHTFFYHIINQYDSLADFTFFSQDDPFDHISNYIDIVNGTPDDWNSQALLKSEGLWFFETCYGAILKSDQRGAPHHYGLNMCSVWNKIFEEACPESFDFAAAGHFCISREQVHKKPKEFYEKVLNVLETDPTSPWCIERLEFYILS